MAFPEKNMEEPSPTPQILTQNPSLSDYLIISCLARVPRLYYPTLSLVSKRFRSLVSLLASLEALELAKARSMLRHSGHRLYVCLKSSNECRLFTLDRRPDQTLTNKEKNMSSRFVLVTVPTIRSLRDGFSSLVAVGSHLYNIGSGSSYYNEPSSSVSVLDCRSHTWHEGTRMRVEVMPLTVAVLDRKIYVAGIREDSYEDVFEVLDTETQTWDHVPLPYRTSGNYFYGAARSACINGKIHVITEDDTFCYNPKEGRWDQREMSLFYQNAYCKIENACYSASRGVFRWNDGKDCWWRDLKGLVGLHSLFQGGGVRMVDYGGNMVVLWDETLRGEKRIWCAEISLERCKNREIWAKVEWVDHILTVPTNYHSMNVVVATV
ncbi:unnamed protein product [Microthlaspi erraticum]|uniref:F-box domain-containing protein n=1 Tax=Microthlaspi erraticum TaxID=1685480 RepID=A0A6D2HCN5_9BRAS|nr:unnamed protein product [Microthlaspi erraticum]